MAKAFAALDDRDVVNKDDANEALKIVLYHRLYGKFSNRMDNWFAKQLNMDNFEYMPHSIKLDKFLETLDSIYRKDIAYIAKAHSNIRTNKELLNSDTLNSIQNTANGMHDKENRSNTTPVAIELANSVVSFIDKGLDE